MEVNAKDNRANETGVENSNDPITGFGIPEIPAGPCVTLCQL